MAGLQKKHRKQGTKNTENGKGKSTENKARKTQKMVEEKAQKTRHEQHRKRQKKKHILCDNRGYEMCAMYVAYNQVATEVWDLTKETPRNDNENKGIFDKRNCRNRQTKMRELPSNMTKKIAEINLEMSNKGNSRNKPRNVKQRKQQK